MVMGNPVLVEVLRGTSVESRHRGAFVVMDADGAVVLSAGEIDLPVFPRSAVKALQALPLVENGFADRFGLSADEIALCCSSHSGEPRHVAASASMLAKAGHDRGCLECGSHWPIFEKSQRAMVAAGETPTALHNNCSGKHAGFVCLSCGIDADPKGYVGASHPVQKAVRAALVEMTGAAHDNDRMGIDGCSIPTYAVPLKALAVGFARFGADGGSGATMGPQRVKAAQRIRAAVAAHPSMVAGTGRFDSVLMTALGARAFTKTGAEAVFCGALPELGLGIALKIDDGGTRASEAVMASLIARFLPLEGHQREVVEALRQPLMHNWNGIEVGRVRPIGLD
jgi:L-asparaginase II